MNRSDNCKTGMMMVLLAFATMFMATMMLSSSRTKYMRMLRRRYGRAIKTAGGVIEDITDRMR